MYPRIFVQIIAILSASLALFARESEADIPLAFNKKSNLEKLKIIQTSYSNLAGLYETVDKVRHDARESSEELKLRTEKLLATMNPGTFNSEEYMNYSIAICLKERADINFQLNALNRGKWLQSFNRKESKSARLELAAEFERKLLELDRKETMLKLKLEKRDFGAARTERLAEANVQKKTSVAESTPSSESQAAVPAAKKEAPVEKPAKSKAEENENAFGDNNFIQPPSIFKGDGSDPIVK